MIVAVEYFNVAVDVIDVKSRLVLLLRYNFKQENRSQIALKSQWSWTSVALRSFPPSKTLFQHNSKLPSPKYLDLQWHAQKLQVTDTIIGTSYASVLIQCSVQLSSVPQRNAGRQSQDF